MITIANIHGIVAVGILCDFVRVSLSTLKMVMDNQRLVSEWVGMLKTSSKPEMSSSVLHSIARVLHQDDAHYLGSVSTPETVFNGAQQSLEHAGKELCVALGNVLIEVCSG